MDICLQDPNPPKMFYNKRLNIPILVLAVAMSATSCVSTKKFQDLQAERDRLDLALEKAHREIKDLRETKFSMEDQLRNNKEQIERLDSEAKTQKQAAENYAQKFAELDSKVRGLSTELDSKKTEATTLVNNYEQKLTEMQQKIETLSKQKSSAGSRRKSRSSVIRKINLPAALKL
jgi:chromosome segregation ATPase